MESEEQNSAMSRNGNLKRNGAKERTENSISQEGTNIENHQGNIGMSQQHMSHSSMGGRTTLSIKMNLAMVL